MSDKFSAKKAVLLGLGAACIYRFAKGEGVFNKPRFYQQHKAVLGYLETYHPTAVAGSIVKNNGGWHCIVKNGTGDFVLNINKANDGTFIFSETQL